VQNFNKELKEKINKATIQLKQKNRKLKELIKFQKDIMDIMGHELRTPLGITRNALLSLNLARKKAIDNKIDISQFESMMDIAIRNIEREIDLVETILTSAKIDNAKLVLNTKKVNLIKILEEVYQSYQEPAEKKKLWIKKEFTEPEISIEGDEIRLYQVFNNLVSNAVKYTNQGGVTIKAYKQRENAIVEIIDTGEGIPKESIEKLGKKFYRVNNYINKSQNTETIQNLVVRPGGTGLGLYVTFELTRLMKGEIKVTSKLGEGSNFTVIFPLVKSEQKTS
jgi:signal transduction histidine kinase